MTRDDVPALAAASGESREHYRFNPVPDGVRETEEYVERALASQARGQRYPFVISYRGRIVGTTSYSDYQPWEWLVPSEHSRTDRPNAVEVGYTWLAASAQRTGCNTEAKFLLFEHAFEVWKVHSVCLRTDQRNQRSRDSIERLGATWEGIRRAHSPGADGTVRSSAFFSILAEEWPSVRERLQRLMHPPAGPRKASA
jgi:RimJ/RimL family protein N-acetyltransferase